MNKRKKNTMLNLPLFLQTFLATVRKSAELLLNGIFNVIRRHFVFERRHVSVSVLPMTLKVDSDII